MRLSRWTKFKYWAEAEEEERESEFTRFINNTKWIKVGVSIAFISRLSQDDERQYQLNVWFESITPNCCYFALSIASNSFNWWFFEQAHFLCTTNCKTAIKSSFKEKKNTNNNNISNYNTKSQSKYTKTNCIWSCRNVLMNLKESIVIFFSYCFFNLVMKRRKN